MRGVVKKMFHVKGFGFVIDEDGKDRFLHANNLRDSREWFKLGEGDRVEFDPVLRLDAKTKDNNGLGMQNVRRL